jgi:hypothetical protein
MSSHINEELQIIFIIERIEASLIVDVEFELSVQGLIDVLLSNAVNK